jgi:hypothetical protein
LAPERLLVTATESPSTFGLQGALALRQSGKNLGPQSRDQTGIDGHGLASFGAFPFVVPLATRLASSGRQARSTRVRSAAAGTTDTVASV